MRCKRLLLAALVCLLPLRGHAVDPTRAISQYAHSAWRLQDGFLSGMPMAIQQTKDGYVWIGTRGGLLRFDGIQFVHWTPPPGRQLPAQGIYALAAGNDGSLWIGTGNGLAHWTGHDLVNYSQRGAIASIVIRLNGEVWITRAIYSDDQGPLCKVSGAHLDCHGKADGIKFPYASALAEDRSGQLWIGDASGIGRWAPGASKRYSLHQLEAGEGLDGVQALAAGVDGALLVGMDRTGKGLGLEQFRQEKWLPCCGPGVDGSRFQVTALFLDRDQALWVGTSNDGIYRIYQSKTDHYSSLTGLSGDSINNFMQDEEGNLWVATSRGIDSFRNLPVATFSKQQSLTADLVASVAVSASGALWIGNGGALELLRDGLLSSIDARHGLPGTRVTSMMEDHNERLWLGIDNGLYVLAKGRFTPIRNTDGKPMGLVSGITEDLNHNIWVQSTRVRVNQLTRFDHDRIREVHTAPEIPRAAAAYSDADGNLWLNPIAGGISRYKDGNFDTDLQRRSAYAGRVHGMLIDTDGSVWGAARFGLLGWRQGKLQLLTDRNGLPCSQVYSVVKDFSDALWLYSACGLIRIAKADVEAWWTNPAAKIQFRVFDQTSGLETASSSFSPGAVRSPDGRLWFANDSVLQMIDPNHLDTNPLPPPVHIEQLIADHTQVAPTSGVRLPPLTKDVEIDYTALSFVMPQQVRFRYKLEGYDSQWQDGNGRRSAFYTNLRPRSYTFLVTACNNSGVWNSNGAALTFVILPAWYQTLSFRLLSILAGAFLCYAFYLARMHRYAASMRANFNERLDERTQIARNLHDTLLQTIQGSKMVADEARSDLSNPAKTEVYLSRLSQWLDRASLEGRAALESLRTGLTESNHLPAAILRFIDELTSNCDMVVSLSIHGQEVEMHPVVCQEVSLIALEAIGNACRHSHGRNVTVKLTYESNMTLLVEDDGIGMDESIVRGGRPNHFGLLGMQERASRIHATLTIRSKHGGGTEVTLVVPGNVGYLSSPGLAGWGQKLRNLFINDSTQSIQQRHRGKATHPFKATKTGLVEVLPDSTGTRPQDDQVKVD
jgi:signal transduction histidine kinase/ligand-binding sensor domain-containing protein